MTDQQTVADLNCTDRNLQQFAVAMPHCAARCARQQCRHFSTRPPFCELLQVLSTGIHQRHDGGRQLLANRQRSRHGKRSNDVQPELTMKQAPADLQGERKQHGYDREGKDQVADAGFARSAEHQAGDESQGRNGQERPRPAQVGHKSRLLVSGRLRLLLRQTASPSIDVCGQFGALRSVRQRSMTDGPHC